MQRVRDGRGGELAHEHLPTQADIPLADDVGFRLSGELTSTSTSTSTDSGPVAGLIRIVGLDQPIFRFVRVDASGRFQARLPAGDYLVLAAPPGHEETVGAIQLRGDSALRLSAAPTGPVATEDTVRSWLSEHAVSLDAGTADRLALDAVLASPPRLLALGEATHGARESTLSRVALIRELAARDQLSAILIEADWAECLALNAYVTEGRGDARGALASTRYWIWDTEEVVEFLGWLRELNRRRPAAERVQFQGFDAAFSGASLALITSLLAPSGPVPPPPAAVSEALAGRGPDLTLAPARDIEAFLSSLRLTIAERRTQLSESDQRAVQRAMFVIERALAASASGPLAGAALREQAMADLVMDLLAGLSGKTAVLWAHNEHVRMGLNDPTFSSMGTLLRARLGEGYMPVGFLFGDGAFRAWDYRPGGNPAAVSPFRVGAPPPDSVETVLRAATKAHLTLWSLEDAPASVASWFRVARPVRGTGASYISENRLPGWHSLAAEFDAIVYADRIAPSTPTATGVRPSPSSAASSP